MGILVKKLGEVKIKDLVDNFDLIIDKHKQIAKGLGYHGDLKFSKEHGKLIIFVEKNYSEEA